MTLTAKQEEIRQRHAKLVAPRTTWLAADLLQLYLNDVPTLLADLEAAQGENAALKAWVGQIARRNCFVRGDGDPCIDHPGLGQCYVCQARDLLAPQPVNSEGGPT